ncbi:ROK family protein [Leifsonia poae]|uniref:ROK family protein n=1 Tax=Leifsonia poae TaxID=110933 RepID=UPI003D691776
MTVPLESPRQGADSVASLLAVVNLVRTGQARTRPGLMQALGLGRAVIAQRVEQAIDIGYLEESELGESTGGRAPRTLRFRADRGRILVCAMGGLHLRVGVSDLNGTILASDRSEWDISAGALETLAVAGELIDDLLAREEAGTAPIWGIGVGVPGPVDFATGRPVAPPIMPGWDGFDLRGHFEQRYNATTWVDNDVNLLALAERSRRGPDDDLNLIYLKVGTGIGAAFVFDGELYRGASGAAGDIGHSRDLRGETVECRCGRTGCLEATASGWALVRDAEAALAAGEPSELAAVRKEHPIRPEDIAIAARHFDQLALRLVGLSAERTGETIANLTNALNPSAIVVGGAISSGADAFVVPFRRIVADRALPLISQKLTVSRSQGNPDEPIRGGNALVVEQLFERTFAAWFADGTPV